TILHGVNHTGTNTSTGHGSGHKQSLNTPMGQPCCQRGTKERRRHRLAHDQLSVGRRKLGHDGAIGIVFLEAQHAGHFQSEHIGIRTIVGEYDARMCYRPATFTRLGKQGHRIGNGLRNVSPAKDIRVGEAVDQINDQQAERGFKFELRAETLPGIRLNVVTHGIQSSITLPCRTTSVSSTRTEQFRNGISWWQAVVRLPPASLLGPKENRKLPSYARASIAMVCSRSYSPRVDQWQRGCSPQPMCEMA